MTTIPPHADEERRPYHHGDLRRELLRVARAEVARKGTTGITLSSIARLANVSQGAPYRHFDNLNDLFEALAAEGFDAFRSAMSAALAQSEGDELRVIAQVYVDYAQANIELYRLMFASRLVPRAKPGSLLANAADAAFAILNRIVTSTSPPGATRGDAVLIWAQLHGLVMLKADGLVETPLRAFVDAAFPDPASAQSGIPR